MGSALQTGEGYRYADAFAVMKMLWHPSGRSRRVGMVQEELTGLLVNYRAWRGAMESYPWAEDQYFVVLHKGEWKIKHNRRHSHPYETQADAMRLTLRTEREGCLTF